MTPAADREMAERLLSDLAIGLSADHEYFTVNLNENIAAVLSLIAQVYEKAAERARASQSEWIRYADAAKGLDSSLGFAKAGEAWAQAEWCAKQAAAARESAK